MYYSARNQKEESDIVRDIIAALKTSKEYESVRTRSNGSCFQVSITITLLKDVNDQVIGATHIIRDVDILKVAQEKQSLLAAIIDSSDDAIVSKNLNGIITSWNAGAERIFGFMAHEAVGKHISFIIPDERIAEENMILGKIHAGERLDHFETVRKRKDGRTINISLTVSPVRNANGEIIGASKIGRDISEKVEIERQKKIFTEQ